MKKNLRSLLALSLAFLAFGSTKAQLRYYNEVFTDADIVKASENQVYGINVDFLKNQQLYSPAYIQSKLTQIQNEHNEIRDSILAAVAAGRAPNIRSNFFNPYSLDPSTEIKLITPAADNPPAVPNPFQMGLMDVYMPNPAVDTVTDRPVIIYVHTGNFLPKGLNGGVSGTKDDPTAVELCEQWAKRGYVAVAPNYRLGWNPLATTQSERTRTLLNGVFRAITDIKQVVRTLKTQAANLGIDPNKIILYGQGSGGYVSLAYNYLDKYAETTLPQFDPDATGQTVIDTNLVGNMNGLGGLLNFYQYQAVPGVTADIAFCVNAGGALGDDTWVEGGEAPQVTFHCVRDPFAPFQTGTVIVPTTQEPVVEADGPNVFMPLVNQNGNNAAFENLNTFEDPYTVAARTRYGANFADDIPIIIGGLPVDVSTDAEGLFAFTTPQTNSAPWEWYDEASFRAYHGYLTQLGFAPPTLAAADDIINAQNGPNDMSASMNYIDTIQQYMNRRIMVSLQIGDWQTVGQPEFDGVDANGLSLFPNPAVNSMNILATGNQRLSEVKVFDMSGRIVESISGINTNQLVLNVESYQSGIYVAQIQLDGKTINKKFQVN